MTTRKTKLPETRKLELGKMIDYYLANLEELRALPNRNKAGLCMIAQQACEPEGMVPVLIAALMEESK